MDEQEISDIGSEKWRKLSGGVGLGHRDRRVGTRELGITDTRLPDLVPPCMSHDAGCEERPEVDHD